MMQTSATILALAAASVSAGHRYGDQEEQKNTNVNFATGGSTTGTVSANEVFAAVAPGLSELLAAVDNAKLNVYGMDRQVDFAVATVNDVDEEADLFWVQGGTNNYIVQTLSGQPGQLPPYDATQSPGEIVNLLTRLYNELGARRFVVPNLIPAGDAPFYAPFGLADFVNGITTQHNALLKDLVEEFKKDHRDAEVVLVDANLMYSNYLDANEGIDMGSCAGALKNPDSGVTNCSNFLYLDDVHPKTGFWSTVAKQATGQIVTEFGDDIERIITIGDSFSDAGSFINTVSRSIFQPFHVATATLANGAPFTEGRFTEGKNVVQLTEDELSVPYKSAFFKQPSAFPQNITRGVDDERKIKREIDFTGEAYIPRSIGGEGHGRIVLTFRPVEGRKVKCRYIKRRQENEFLLHRCSQRAEGGDKVAVASFTTKEGVVRGGINFVSQKRVNSANFELLGNAPCVDAAGLMCAQLVPTLQCTGQAPIDENNTAPVAALCAASCGICA